MAGDQPSASVSGDSLRLKEALDACSEACRAGDYADSSEAVAAVIRLLDSIIDEPPLSDSECVAEEALSEILGYVSSPSSNQMAVDALSLELPKVVMKFASLSDRCREIVGSIIDCIVSVCSPRDMLSILCEALGIHSDVAEEPVKYIPLLSGLSRVFLRIQRHHVKQVKEALPVILRTLEVVSSELDIDDKNSLNNIYLEAFSIGTSIQTICQKLVERERVELVAVLGLYVLQNIALISRSRLAHIVSNCSSLVAQFSVFLPFCGLSYFGLITGSDVAAIALELSEEDDNDFMRIFPFVMDGASLAVLWGHISDEVSKAAGEQMTVVLNKIQNNHSKRLHAVGMLKYALSLNNNHLEIVSHSIDLLLNMMDGSKFEDSNDNQIDFFSFMPSLFAALQAIETLMIVASDASLMKKAFFALRKVVSVLPSSERFDILKALITHSSCPSMVAILIDLVKAEILINHHQKSLPRNDETVPMQRKTSISPFWSSNALELLELILKPPQGDSPSLPEHTEPVLAALNLYRFIFLIESTGKTNHSGVLSKEILKKAHSEWLMPLRLVVLRILAETEEDDSEVAENIRCTLNPVQLVLYRCIELVEDVLKHSE